MLDKSKISKLVQFRKTIQPTIKSGKSNSVDKSSETQSSVTFHIVSQKYFVSRQNGMTYLVSWLDMGNFNQLYNLTKSNGSGKPDTQLTESEFQSIITNKPKWVELQRGYKCNPVNSGANCKVKLNTDSPVIVW